MFCYLTTEFSKIQNRFGIGWIKRVDPFCMCLVFWKNIFFINKIPIVCEKKDIQINNEIRPQVIGDCKDYKNLIFRGVFEYLPATNW